MYDCMICVHGAAVFACMLRLRVGNRLLHEVRVISGALLFSDFLCYMYFLSTVLPLSVFLDLENHYYLYINHSGHICYRLLSLLFFFFFHSLVISFASLIWTIPSLLLFLVTLSFLLISFHLHTIFLLYLTQLFSCSGTKPSSIFLFLFPHFLSSHPYPHPCQFSHFLLLISAPFLPLILFCTQLPNKSLSVLLLLLVAR